MSAAKDTQLVEREPQLMMAEVRRLRKQWAILAFATGILSSVAGAIIASTSLSTQIDYRVLRFLIESDTARTVIAGILGGIMGALVFGVLAFGYLLRRVDERKRNAAEKETKSGDV